LAKIGHLRLRARTVVEGFIAGQHHSTLRGHSLEFSQHREYATGDELRHIDWKVYGRSDRFFVKQFEEETNLRLQIVLDASGSMGFRGEKSALSKYDYGATLAASLAYLALRQGDAVGLSLLAPASPSIPPRSALSHLNVLTEELGRVQPAGESRLPAQVEEVARLLKKRSLLVLISDLLDDPESVIRALRFLHFKRNEAVVMHLLDPDERDFPYQGAVRFQSMENAAELTFEAESLKEAYRKQVSGMIEGYRSALRGAGIDYVFSATDEPFDRPLRQVLKHSNG
jgi:uncharacterized protein (DUF58 family)